MNLTGRLYFVKLSKSRFMREKMNIDESSEIKAAMPSIAIVGRPNDSDSSLFNAILGKRVSIVHEESGVTRDRIVSPTVWGGMRFLLVDTGGLGVFKGQKKNLSFWEGGIQEQVKIAIEDADILFFVVDIQSRTMPLDREIASRLKSSGKKVCLIANKADNPKLSAASIEFAELGFEKIFPVSTLHRAGIDDLMEYALDEIGAETIKDRETEPFSIAVIGRPNVGKSSLVNRLLGENRVMVSDVPGTTRDAIDVEFGLEYKDGKIPAVLIDTAGLRKKAKLDSAVEMFSVMRAETAIQRAKLVLFVVEAKPEGLSSQDRHIARMISDENKACLILANKWDLCKGYKQEDILEEIRYTLPHMNYAPLLFICALSGYNMSGVLDSIAEIIGRMDLKISTSILNRAIADAVEKNSPPVVGCKPFKIYYGTMTGNLPPRFTLFVNKPELCAPNYFKYLVNYMRKSFDFTGLPLLIKLRPKTTHELEGLPKKRFSQENKGKSRHFPKKGKRKKTK